MLLTRRLASLALLSGGGNLWFGSMNHGPDSVVPALPDRSTLLLVLAAAPGIQLSPTDEIRAALQNPATTVVDARGTDQVIRDGFFDIRRRRLDGQVKHWINAPCTLEEGCPLLSVAAENMIPDMNAPVIVYCATGKRAALAQQVLQNQGYRNVLNAGAYPTDLQIFQ